MSFQLTAEHEAVREAVREFGVGVDSVFAGSAGGEPTPASSRTDPAGREAQSSFVTESDRKVGGE